MTRLLSILFLAASSAHAATYYFSSSGDDSNSGTNSAAPFKTLTKIAALTFATPPLGPGDSVLLKAGDTFDTIATFYVSGTAGSPILMDRYGVGANPIIVGDNPNVVWSSVATGIYVCTPAQAATVELVATPGGTKYTQAANTNNWNAWADYTWAINGSQIYARADGNAPAAGTHLFQYSAVTAKAYTQIANLDIRRSKNAVVFNAATNSTVNSCSMSDCTQFAVYFANSRGMGITSNTVNRVGYTALYSQSSHNGRFAYNAVTNVTTTILGIPINGSELCGVGIQQGTNNVVEWNTFDHIGQSFVDFYYEVDAQIRYNFGYHAATVAAPMGTGINFHHNVFNVDGGVGLSCSHAYDSILSPAPDSGPVTIYNNTIYGFTQYSIYTSGATASGVVVKDNIFYGGNNALMSQMSSGVVSDYNLYYCTGTPTWDWNDAPVAGFAGLQSASGQEAHGQFANPLFVVASPSVKTNFQLQATSPAKGAGVLVSAGLDFAGLPVLNPPSLGAYEYYGRTVLQSGTVRAGKVKGHK